jgi:hypothetical protein
MRLSLLEMLLLTKLAREMRLEEANPEGSARSLRANKIRSKFKIWTVSAYSIAIDYRKNPIRKT